MDGPAGQSLLLTAKLAQRTTAVLYQVGRAPTGKSGCSHSQCPRTMLHSCYTLGGKVQGKQWSELLGAVSPRERQGLQALSCLARFVSQNRLTQRLCLAMAGCTCGFDIAHDDALPVWRGSVRTVRPRCAALSSGMVERIAKGRAVPDTPAPAACTYATSQQFTPGATPRVRWLELPDRATKLLRILSSLHWCREHTKRVWEGAR